MGRFDPQGCVGRAPPNCCLTLVELLLDNLKKGGSHATLTENVFSCPSQVSEIYTYHGFDEAVSFMTDAFMMGDMIHGPEPEPSVAHQPSLPLLH